MMSAESDKRLRKNEEGRSSAQEKQYLCIRLAAREAPVTGRSTKDVMRSLCL